MQQRGRIQRFALLWALLLILQQFDVVLLMNVAQLSGHRTIKNEQPRWKQSSRDLPSVPNVFQNPKRSGEGEAHDVATTLQKSATTELFKGNATEGVEELKFSPRAQAKRDKRSIGEDINRVIEAIKTSVETMDNRDTFARNVSTWLRSCHSHRDQNIHFWRKHVALYPFFLVTLSIALYVRGCREELKNHLQELLDILDANDVIDFVEDFNILRVKDLMSGSSERDFMHDADTPEAMINAESEEIVVENFKNIKQLSEIFDDFNGRSRRSHYGLQPALDDIITQYEVLKSMYSHEENDRTKRNAGNRKPENSLTIDREVLAKILDKRFVQDSDHILSSSITRHAFKSINDRLYSQILPQTNPLHRQRRAADMDDETARPFFIKNSAFPCKLLTAKMSGGQYVMSMESYSEEALQLWVWENGHLRNFGNKLYANLESQLLSDSAPRTLLRKLNDWLAVDGRENSGCYVEVKVAGFSVELRKNCQGTSQKWHFVQIEKARESFDSVVCLFVIQNRDSCLVLEHRQEHLRSRPVPRQVHTQQLWYWDHHRIRNAYSHMYLASNGSEMFLTDSKQQAWSYKEWPVDDVTKVTFPGISHATSQANDNIAKGDWDLTDAGDDEKMRCGRKHYYVLKNTEKPCNVLCVEETDNGPYLSVPASVGILSFMVVTVFALSVAGVYHQRQGKQTPAKLFFIAAAAVGLVTSVCVTCAAVVRKVVKLIKFDYFDPENPLNCLWYSQKEKLVNVRHGSDLNTNSSEVELTMNQGMLKQLGKENCYLHVAGEQSISCQNEPTNSSWGLVDYDDNEFSAKIFCLYVLPQNKPRCEDMRRYRQTTGGHGVAHDKQTDDDHDVLEQKLWYFHGDNLVNLDSGDVFNGSVSEQSPINFINYTQNCSTSLSLFFIQTKAANRRILGFDRSEGNVSFQTYNDDNVLDKLWYIKGSHIFNYATGYKLMFNVSSTNRTVFLTHRAQSDEMEWYAKDNRITVATVNETFSIMAETVNSENRLVAKNALSNIGQANAHWTFVPFHDLREYIHELMIFYFIQSHDEPCEVLTADNSTEMVFTAPVSGTKLYSQLWFTYKGEILNVGNGLSLGYGAYTSEQVKLVSNDQTTFGTKWTIHGSTIQPTLLSVKVLSINTNTGLVEIKNNSSLATQKWKMLEFSQAIDQPESLACFKYDLNDSVFIKHESIPCKVLTASDDGLSITFQEFEESIVARQLWYFRYGHLVNVEFGRSVKVNEEAVSLVETRKYDSQQYLIRNGTSVVKALNGKTICSMWPTKSDDGSSLTCKNNNFSAMKWSFVQLDDGLHDIGSIRCLTLIQSRVTPCEFITGYVSDEKYGTLKLRPMIDDLVDTQIFYWRNYSLVHLKSGLVVSESPGALTLQQSSHSSSKFVYEPFLHHIAFANSNKAVAFNPNNDGVLVKEDIRYISKQKWSFIELNDDMHEKVENCPERSQPSTYFFIKHRDQPCLVLTGANQGESPEFKIFNQDSFYDQVWYVRNNQIVNVGKDLAMMLGDILPENTRQVIMWHRYAYSLRQRFILTTTQSSSIQSQMDMNCFLSSDDFGTGSTANAVCRGKGSSNWNFVDINEDYIQKVTCRFFIQSEEVPPCELLTGQGIDRQVRLRPLDTDDVESQLWYWDGDRILNAKTKMAISDYGNTITLRRKDESLTQTWLYENTRVKSRTNPNHVITFSHDTGGVYLSPLSRWKHVLKYQSWTFLREKDGFNNPDRLRCISTKSNPDMYIIRSEHKDCPLLKHVGNDRPGVRKLQKNVDAGVLWVLQNDHLINVEAKKSLMATRASTLRFETTYTHEPRQHWEMGNDRIKSWLYGPQFLEVSGSSVKLASHQETTKQDWQWFTLKEYENDNKLMRCSRCYNKQEETASEVIGYIPIFGLLYNLFRSVPYAAKQCPDVALTALMDFGLNIAFDLVSLLSGGTASALAYGLKTGLKFGIKAGLKATFHAVKGMVKMSILTAKNGFKNLAKNGLRQTLKFKLKTAASTMRTQLKTSIKSLKITLTSSSRSLKAHMIKLGRFMLKGSTHIKATKSGKALSGLSKFNNFPELFRNVRKFIIDKIQSSGKNLKSKIKRKLDDLSNKAEDAINRSKHHKVRNTKLMCRRFRRTLVPSGLCENEKVLRAASDDQTIDALSDARRYPRQGNEKIVAPENIRKDFESLCDKAQLNDPKLTGQFGAIAIKQNGELREVHKKTISEIISMRKQIPPDPNSIPIRETQDVSPAGPKHHLRDVRHVEQSLMETLDMKKIQETCTEKSPCTMYLFTKNSPCSNHAMGPKTLSCTKYIGGQCKNLKHVRCVVGFDQIYTPLDYLHDESWRKYFDRVFSNHDIGDLFSNHKWIKQEDVGLVQQITEDVRRRTSPTDADALRREVNKQLTKEMQLTRMLELREQNTDIFWL